MYLAIFLADFAVFRVFLGISRDFAEIPEFRGSATARNIRSPAKSTSIQALRNVETHTYPRLTRLSKWATSALCFAGHITNLSERETVKEWLPSYREWLSQKFSLWSITKSGLEVRTCCKNGEFRTQATWLGNCEKPWRNRISNSVG